MLKKREITIEVIEDDDGNICQLRYEGSIRNAIDIIRGMSRGIDEQIEYPSSEPTLYERVYQAIKEWAMGDWKGCQP